MPNIRIDGTTLILGAGLVYVVYLLSKDGGPLDTVTQPLADMIAGVGRVHPKGAIILEPENEYITVDQLVQSGGKINAFNRFTWNGTTYRVKDRRDGVYYAEPANPGIAG